MIKSISYWSFADGMSVEDRMRLAKASGYEAIELTLEAEGEICPETPADDIKRFKQMANEIGLQTPTVASGLYWSDPVVGPDDAAGEKGMAIVRKQLEFAQVLGAATILVVPCTVTPEFPYDMAYDRALEIFSGPIAEEAAQRGVNIGIENVWNKFLLSPLEFRNLLDEINKPFVGAYFDVGNVLISAYPDQWIRILGERIKAVHLKDFKCSIGTIEGFIDLLEGDVPWDRVMAAFKAIGYDGPVTAEMMPPYQHFPNRLIEATSKSMDEILKL